MPYVRAVERNYTVTPAGIAQRRAAAQARANRTRKARERRRARAQRMVALGKSYQQIGDVLGVSKQRVLQILREGEAA